MRKTIAHAILTGTMLLVLFGAAPAQASPIYVKGHGLGVENLYMIGPQFWQGFVGQVRLNTGLDGTSDDFIGWCVDATRSRDMAQDMTIRPLSELPDSNNPSTDVQPNAGARIAWLINTYSNDDWLATDGNYKAAALQLAVWEVLYDPFGSYNISSGHFFLMYFEFYAGTYRTLVDYTNLYFTSLGSNTSEAYWYDNTDRNLSTGQDFAVDPPTVPDSGSTIVLLGSSLLAMARAARRRRRLQ